MSLNSNLARLIQRDRKRSHGFPMKPSDYATMVQLFPPSLMITKGGGDFLIYMGTVDGDEYASPDAPYMLVYASLHGLQRVSGADMWHRDGTFKSCPKPFKQVMLYALSK